MPCTKLTPAQQKVLRSVARQAIDSGLADKVFRPNLRGADTILTSAGASFVTITEKDILRGCIGTLQAHQPLLIDVASNAIKAAFKDPRFTPLTKEVWEKCAFSIAVLSRPQDLHVASEQELYDKLRPGIDGLILSWGHHQATYLPAVWEQLSDPAVFVGELKHKAGLAQDFWSSDMCFAIYQSESF